MNDITVVTKTGTPISVLPWLNTMKENLATGVNIFDRTPLFKDNVGGVGWAFTARQLVALDPKSVQAMTEAVASAPISAYYQGEADYWKQDSKKNPYLPELPEHAEWEEGYEASQSSDTRLDYPE